MSTQDAPISYGGDSTSDNGGGGGGGLRSYLPLPGSHRRNASKSSIPSSPSRRLSGENFASQQRHVLYREEQRVSLRAFLRTFLKNEQIAQSKAMSEFLTGNATTVNEEEMEDIERRKEMDERRVEDQRRFYEIARQRAAELDVHMEKFRKEIVESSECRKTHLRCSLYTNHHPQTGYRICSRRSEPRTRSQGSGRNIRNSRNGAG